MKKYAKNLKEAKQQLKERGKSGDKIFKLKLMKTKTHRYFVGSYMEWLNL